MDTRSIDTSREYWDRAARDYDYVFPLQIIGQLQRAAVWRKLAQVFPAGDRILELNCGTGIDAAYLAERGVRVLACDLSPRMIEVAGDRLRSRGLSELVEFRALPTEEIASLSGEGLFDGAFSNFSGLNCVEDLSAVAANLARLLRPGARVLICVIGRFVPWEMVWYLAHAEAGRATLRLKRSAHNGEHGVKVYYHSVPEIARMFSPGFRLRHRSGIGITVPPTQLEHLARRFPAAAGRLARVDQVLGKLPLFRAMGDCALLEFERM